MDLPGASALDIARAVATHEVSCVQVVEAALDRIERLNPAANAIAWVREAAREDARAADARLAGGEPAGPLEGAPFTVKDSCAIADGPSRHGSKAYEGHSHGVDAELVSRLKRAGAILVGTTVMSEFGNRPTTESILYGATPNPWDPTRTAGGSTGGGAVSAALGIAPLNHGSDGGGSVRIPAACCGVFGLKTSRGRISFAPLYGEVWGGLDVYGPITRTVGDAAAFLDATAGPATGDPSWLPLPRRPFVETLRGERRMRVAVAFERDGEAVDPEQKEAVRATADLLADLGHDVREAQPDLLPLQDSFVTVSTIGIGQEDLDDARLALVEPRVRLIVEVARAVPAIDYLRALDRMHAATRDAVRFFADVDALITPTISRPAPRIGEIGADTQNAWEDYRNWLCWTWPFNATGQPAATVPAGFSSEALPLSVQIVGGPSDDETVLELAAQLERARPWAQHRPPGWVA